MIIVLTLLYTYSFVRYSNVPPTFSVKWNKQVLDSGLSDCRSRWKRDVIMASVAVDIEIYQTSPALISQHNVFLFSGPLYLDQTPTVYYIDFQVSSKNLTSSRNSSSGTDLHNNPPGYYAHGPKEYS